MPTLLIIMTHIVPRRAPEPLSRAIAGPLFVEPSVRVLAISYRISTPFSSDGSPSTIANDPRRFRSTAEILLLIANFAESECIQQRQPRPLRGFSLSLF